MSSPNSGESSTDWRACIQLTFPRQRVDFAVMADVAIGMRQMPTGKRIGREALVHQAKRADHIGIGQLIVEIRDLGASSRPL